MIGRCIHWFFRSVTPYLVGMLLGIGFFVLLLRFVDAPNGPLQSLPRFSEETEWLSMMLKRFEHLDFPDAVTAIDPGIMQDNHQDRVSASPANEESSETLSEAPLLSPSPPAASATPSTPVAMTGGLSGDTPPVPRRQNVTPSLQDPPSGRSVREMAVAKASAPVEPDEQNTKGKPVFAPPANNARERCGSPPRWPGPDQERYLACIWRRNCLIRLENYQKMLEDGLKNCPQQSTHAPMCRNFYRSLQRQNPPQLCDTPPWSGMHPSKGAAKR
ncbi:MAG: hypothetical protein HQL76_14255 [Magnetococcales bacterium]|nr:hypothetical protein [Magnetococcales bacterium]